MLFNSSTTYGAVAKFFHWAIALLVIIMLAIGLTLGSVPKPWFPTVINLHKLTGLLILCLMVLRLLWWMINSRPAPAATWWGEKIAERIVHGLLYVTVLAMPIAGWIGSSAAGKFPHIGSLVFALPVHKDKALSKWAFDWHGIIGLTIIVLLCIHIAAALYHHLIKKDNVLKRMMPESRI